MRASNESSGEIKWRASESGLQSVQHAEALFSGGVDIGADGAKVLSAAEGGVESSLTPSSPIDARSTPMDSRHQGREIPKPTVKAS
jgi:hypothetical protein